MTLDELRRSTAAVLTITDVAGLLGVDERTVSRALGGGQLPCLDVGRRRLIPREPLLALLTAPHATAPAPSPGTGTDDEVTVSPTPTRTSEVPDGIVAPDFNGRQTRRTA